MVTGGGDGVGVCSRRRPREKKEKVFGDDIVSEGLGLGDIYPDFTKLVPLVHFLQYKPRKL